MRIAYLSNSRLPSTQANTVHVVNMASALAELGHDVELWIYNNQNTGQSGYKTAQIASDFGVAEEFGVRSIPQINVPARSTISAIAIARQLSRQKPDLVVGRHPKACAVSALLGQNVLFETHQPIRWYPAPDRLFIRAALAANRYAGLITISNPLRAILLDEADLEPSSILVAHDAAAPVDELTPKPLANGGRTQIGYVGQLYRGRGVEIIEALARRLPDVDFHVIGGDTADLADWCARTADLRNMIFHGHVSAREASEFRLGCDILLAPYQRDASIPGGRVTSQWMSPLKLFEYMAAGKAFIASDLPVLREVLDPNRNCLLVPPDDIEAWEQAAKLLISDDTLRRELGTAALEDFRASHTWKARAANIVEFALANVQNSQPVRH